MPRLERTCTMARKNTLPVKIDPSAVFLTPRETAWLSRTTTGTLTQWRHRKVGPPYIRLEERPRPGKRNNRGVPLGPRGRVVSRRGVGEAWLASCEVAAAMAG